MIGIESIAVAPEEHLGNAVFARKMIGHFQAIELQELADYAAAGEGLDGDFAHLEVAAGLHISDRAAQHRIRFAITLTSRLPQTLAMLKQGGIEEYKAQLIAQAVEPLSDEHAREVEQRVLDMAPAQTPTQLRNRLAKVVLAVDPEGAEERRRERLRDRQVTSRPTDDGMAALTVHHTAEAIAAAHGVITARARQLKAMGGEARTVSELEADVALELLSGAGIGGRAVEVHLTVPATSMAGLDNQPGEVDGLPVTAQAARDLAREAASWRWIRTDPSGAVVDLTHRRHDPPELLDTFVKVRDRTCRFPGCTRRARLCDIDHITPWPAGPTCDTNCACLCRRHHRAKHKGGWQVTQVRPDWFEWTSPLGATHVVAPDPVAEPPPPAPDPPPF